MTLRTKLLVGAGVVALGLLLAVAVPVLLVMSVVAGGVGSSASCALPGGGRPSGSVQSGGSDPGEGGGLVVAPSEPYREGQAAGTQSLTVTPQMLSNVAAVRASIDGVIVDRARADRALLIAVLIGLVETGLRNPASRAVPESLTVPHDGVSAGDADSVGFYQQRAYAGYYGTPQDLMNLDYSTRMFLGAPAQNAPAGRAWGLLDYDTVHGVDWMSVDPGQVAAQIQRPLESLRYRYGLWVPAAGQVIEAAVGVSVDTTQMGSSCYDTNGVPVGQIPAGDTYLEQWQTSAVVGAIDPWSFYWGECVSYAAWMVRSTTRYTDFTNNWTHNGVSAHFGNAAEWPAAARAVGIPVDQTPAVGSIAYRSSGTWGHVAFVTAVHPDGSIDVSEYNHAAHHRYGERTQVDWRATGEFTGFIHFEQ